MKLNTWNHHIKLIAENEQDIDYLNWLVDHSDDLKIIDNYISCTMGYVDPDGTLQIGENIVDEKNEKINQEEIPLSEAKTLTDITGVIELQISLLGIFIPKWIKKALKQDAQKYE